MRGRPVLAMRRRVSVAPSVPPDATDLLSPDPDASLIGEPVEVQTDVVVRADPSNLANPRVARQLLSSHGIWLTKNLGQHLLVDEDVLQRIVLAARLHPGLEVLEVGPGIGVLTAQLVARVRRVVAIEVDHRMAGALREAVPARNLEIVEADALRIDLADLFGGRPYALVANLPYNMATALIRQLLMVPAPYRPVEIVVMIQREVAKRMAARPGDLTALGVEVQVFAEAEVLFEVPPTAFFPPPAVTSAVIRFRPYDDALVPLLPSARRFFQTVRAGFAHRRKQLHNALGDLGMGTERINRALELTGIARTRRAETLTLPEWSKLSIQIWEATDLDMVDQQGEHVHEPREVATRRDE